jgi:hypothetical protein
MRQYDVIIGAALGMPVALYSIVLALVVFQGSITGVA